MIKVLPYGFLIMEIRIIYFCVAELFITQRMCNKDVIGVFCSKYFLITCASPPMCMSAGIFNNNMLASQYGPTSKFTILNIFALFSKFASFWTLIHWLSNNAQYKNKQKNYRRRNTCFSCSCTQWEGIVARKAKKRSSFTNPIGIWKSRADLQSTQQFLVEKKIGNCWKLERLYDFAKRCWW